MLLICNHKFSTWKIGKVGSPVKSSSLLHGKLMEMVKIRINLQVPLLICKYQYDTVDWITRMLSLLLSMNRVNSTIILVNSGFCNNYEFICKIRMTFTWIVRWILCCNEEILSNFYHLISLKLCIIELTESMPPKSNINEIIWYNTYFLYL